MIQAINLVLRNHLRKHLYSERKQLITFSSDWQGQKLLTSIIY